MSDVVSATHLSICTASRITSVLKTVSRGAASKAVGDGFYFDSGFAITSAKPCSVNLRVSVEQADIQGLGGTFSVGMEAEESASFAP